MSLATLLIANYHNQQILYQFNNSHVKYNLKEEASFIISKAALMKSKAGQRHNLSSDYGKWFLIKAESSTLYAVCVEEDYPERLAYGVIQKIRTFVKEKSIDIQNSKKLSTFTKELKTICQKYKDSRADKVKDAQFAVQDLKGQLNKGIKKVFDNHENLDKLNDRTSLMKDYAKEFQRSAIVVEKQAFCKKWRLHLILGFIIGSVLIVTGTSIYIRTHQ